ncbi:MAG: exodeoxyribonuclease VII large subunit [Magnetococcales bacterium]|nr:exodeoxyribonuclease VII large subunit [Magnetococcales bacterium]
MTGFATCLTVSQLNEEIRDLLEEEYPYLQVRGEIADWKIAPSGHVYFSLVDAQSRIRAVIWKTTRMRIPTLPRSGDAVVTTGRISVYTPRGEYQWVVEGLRPDGAGGEREKLLALHAKLTAEGVFEVSRKRPLPFLPRAVGVVTSASGAAIHDITRTLDRRFPAYHLILAHARVQGEGAPEEIVQALQRLAADDRAEVILCGRGGGSAEDLAAFNAEIVVRAIAHCPIPVISAVGHEIDVTLADLAADARASTPSAAAEMAMPEMAMLATRLNGLQTRLLAVVIARIQTRQERLASLRARLVHPRRRIEQARLRCDELQQRLLLALHRLIARRRQTTEHLAARLAGWGNGKPLMLRGTRLHHLETRLISQTRQGLKHHQDRLRLLNARLTAISPLHVLTRGYALVQDEHGTIARDATLFPPGTTLRVTLASGTLTVQVTGVKEP